MKRYSILLSLFAGIVLTSACVPFLVTNKGYGLIWDNPSKILIEPAGSVTRLHWDNQKQQLTHEGAAAWTGADTAIVEVAGHCRSSF
jgi:hypothetical protein